MNKYKLLLFLMIVILVLTHVGCKVQEPDVPSTILAATVETTIEPTLPITEAETEATEPVSVEIGPGEDSEYTVVSEPILTTGKTVGKKRMLSRTSVDQLDHGSFQFGEQTVQTLDNGCIRYTLEFKAPGDMDICIYDPTEARKFKYEFDRKTKEDGRYEQIVFDMEPALLEDLSYFTLGFIRNEQDRFLVNILVPEGDNAYLTEGSPIGMPKTLEFSTADHLRTTTVEIQSITAQALDNGYIRYSAEYSAPEGMGIQAFGNTGLYQFLMVSPVLTEEGNGCFSFDLTQQQSRSTPLLRFMLFFGDNNLFNVFIENPFSAGAYETDGIPLTEAVDVEYEVFQKSGKTIQIHSLTAQELDNGCYRYLLTYTAPLGMNIGVHLSTDDDGYRLLGLSGLTGRENTLIFDIEADIILAKEWFNIMIMGTEGNYAASVYHPQFASTNTISTIP